MCFQIFLLLTQDSLESNHGEQHQIMSMNTANSWILVFQQFGHLILSTLLVFSKEDSTRGF